MTRHDIGTIRMKISMFVLLIGAMVTFMACDTKVQSSSTADSVGVDRTAEIAGDKTRMADLMRQSYSRGTFDDALAMAMQDSAFASTVARIVAADARLTAQKPVAASSGSTASTSRTAATAVRRSTSGQATRNSGDVLDKAERTAQTANQKIDQAARVKKQAEEAKRKIDAILKP
jgi:hypothetical protein